MKRNIAAGILPATRLKPPVDGLLVHHGLRRLGVACSMVLMFVTFAITGQAWADGHPAKAIVESKGCGGCHYIPGVPTAMGTIGPSLEGLKDRPFIARGTLENTPENLRDWLINPKGILPDTMMPNLGLEADQIDVLIKFLGKL